MNLSIIVILIFSLNRYTAYTDTALFKNKNSYKILKI